MYKYTAKKSVIRDMTVPKTGYWWDKEWDRLSEILRTNDFMLKTTFRVHYKDCCFYSVKRRRKVPLNGYLYPVSLFNEEIV